jgi:hypothetical protein
MILGNILLYIMILCSIKPKRIEIFIWLFMIIYTFMSWEPVYYFLQKGMERIWFCESRSWILEGTGFGNSMNQIIPIAFFNIFGKNKVKKIISESH